MNFNIVHSYYPDERLKLPLADKIIRRIFIVRWKFHSLLICYVLINSYFYEYAKNVRPHLIDLDC